MFIVTGSARTGTSLMMQTLGLLGIEKSGVDFSDEFSNVECNPKGYWDLPMLETIDGVNNDKYKGMAVKLFGFQFGNTEPKYISKVIVCKRDRQKAIDSTMKWLSKENVLNLPNTYQTAEMIYDMNYEQVYKKINDCKLNFLEVWYENMVENTEKTITLIANYLGCKNHYWIQDAINNVGV